MRLFLFYGLLFSFFSCASPFGEKQPAPYHENNRLKKNDLSEHITWYGESYLKLHQAQLIQIAPAFRSYLETLTKEIISANARYLNLPQIPQLIFLKTDELFYFSLPNSKIILTSSLFKYTIDSESHLALLICQEAFRINFQVYQKQRVIPQGLYLNGELKGFFQNDLEQRTELNKWTYHCLENAGFNPTSVLAWIQKQNKIPLGSWIRPDIKTLAIEESMFKSFLLGEATKNGVYGAEDTTANKNFYGLTSFLREKNDQI